MSSETTCSVWHFNASPQREDAPKWSRVPQSWFVDKVVEETGITVGDVTGNRAVIWGPGQWGKGPWSVQLYNQMNEPVEEFIAADFPSLVALMKELRAAFSF